MKAAFHDYTERNTERNMGLYFLFSFFTPSPLSVPLTSRIPFLELHKAQPYSHHNYQTRNMENHKNTNFPIQKNKKTRYQTKGGKEEENKISRKENGRKLYQERLRRVRPQEMASLHPLQTPEATITIRSSSTSETILNNNSTGMSFHSVITLPPGPPIFS